MVEKTTPKRDDGIELLISDEIKDENKEDEEIDSSEKKTINL